MTSNFGFKFLRFSSFYGGFNLLLPNWTSVIWKLPIYPYQCRPGEVIKKTSTCLDRLTWQGHISHFLAFEFKSATDGMTDQTRKIQTHKKIALLAGYLYDYYCYIQVGPIFISSKISFLFGNIKFSQSNV